MEQKRSLFRKGADEIASPEQLDDYLKVTNPGLWAILTAIVFLLAGILVWSVFGRLTTAVTLNGTARGGLLAASADQKTAAALSEGMVVKVLDEEAKILEVVPAENGQWQVYIRTSLPDGDYPVEAVVEEIRPISFLLGET